MIELREQKVVVNIIIAKALLEKLKLCKDGCDCGCVDEASKIDACKDGCDCGCAGGVELCKDGCDCGCQDNVQHTNSTEQCNCEHCKEQSQTSFSNGGDDNDDKNGEKKIQNQTMNNNPHKENCDCNHNHQNHNGHHHHNHHNGEHCGCGCEHHHNEQTNNEQNHNNCESERNLANEYLTLARQIQADFDNYRRRNNDAVKQAKNEGIRETVLDFLPALDAVDRAVEYMKDDQSREGIMLIRKVFEKAFADFGIEPIMCLGAHYDPNFHDVVVAEESNQPSGTIIEEIETGYTMDGKVIRHSVVKIAK